MLKNKYFENDSNARVEILYGCPVLFFENAFKLSQKDLDFLKNIEYQKSNTEYQEKLVQVSKSQNVLDDYIPLLDVRDKINEYACKYIDELICVDNEFDIVQSWVSKTEPGANHHHHHHKGAMFSLVYYAQADNSKIIFSSRENFLSKNFNFDYNITQYNTLNSEQIWYTPKTGDILIFPGYIMHNAENLDNKTKYILGANYFIRGDIGNYDNTTLVKNV